MPLPSHPERSLRLEGSLAGKLLIAAPAIEDPRFSRAVILVCTHNADHAMGIVLNKASEEDSLPELLDQLGVDGHDAPEDAHVLMGGPVGRERGFVLHSEDYDSEGATLAVKQGGHVLRRQRSLVNDDHAGGFALAFFVDDEAPVARAPLGVVLHSIEGTL